MVRPKGSRNINGWIATPKQMASAGILSENDLQQVSQAGVMVTVTKKNVDVSRLTDKQKQSVLSAKRNSPTVQGAQSSAKTAEEIRKSTSLPSAKFAPNGQVKTVDDALSHFGVKQGQIEDFAQLLNNNAVRLGLRDSDMEKAMPYLVNKTAKEFNKGIRAVESPEEKGGVSPRILSQKEIDTEKKAGLFNRERTQQYVEKQTGLSPKYLSSLSEKEIYTAQNVIPYLKANRTNKASLGDQLKTLLGNAVYYEEGEKFANVTSTQLVKYAQSGKLG